MTTDALNLDLFIEMLEMDSTGGHERALADRMAEWLPKYGCKVQRFPEDAKPDQPVNLLLSWGDPRIVFCSHLDTVPPYIPPTLVRDDNGQPIRINGRGTCDAKGQIFSMYTACLELAKKGETGFGLLLLHGEEAGSYGAKEYREYPGGDYVIVGEPTDNRIVTASKGTKSFGIRIKGKAAHSGYPEQGVSAVDLFADLIEKLRAANLPNDPVLGTTTFNVGKLSSDNPQNILSNELTCRIYFRTTFATDAMVCELMQSLSSENIENESFGGDTPMHYFTIPDIETTTVAFGSDAPQLTNFKHKTLLGPGSILVAHTDHEHITIDELKMAVSNYIKIFYSIKLAQTKMVVMKFGGTSIATSDNINRAIEIIREKLPEKPVVVVSALSKITDLLYKLCDSVGEGDTVRAQAIVADLSARHIGVVEGLIPAGAQRRIAINDVTKTCNELERFVQSACESGELTMMGRARIISNGEMLSSLIIWHAMNHNGIETGWIDARKMIITDNNYLKGEPKISEIETRVPKCVEDALKGKDAVITQGFISSSIDGEPTTLGRGGSDYTASLIGMVVDASAIEIWTDVDGVKTADPRRVPNTRSIEKISFEEAAEMAHFGAKVLHPLTIEPAVTKNIPVYVLNTMNPHGNCTAILQRDQIPDGVKSLSFKENIILLNIFSPRMIEISGFLRRIFDIFAECKVSVDLISTSEANISMTVDSSQDVDLVESRLSEFAEVYVDYEKSQVSIIGQNVVNQRGLLRWAMSALNNINIYMISQAASSDNVSFVVDRKDLDEVLLELHKYLFEY